ncbi:hypothetical protein R1flu_010513 [Riccia fluitans]|uniref:Uncharacterized protein n=1 Tax=Riccia fluitans TaxID=41844 RepID=A0ABD1Z567_9MARC
MWIRLSGSIGIESGLPGSTSTRDDLICEMKSASCATLCAAVCENPADRCKMMRRVIIEGELEGPSSCQRVHGLDESTPIQRSVPVPPVLGGLDPAVLSCQLLELLEKVLAPSVPLEKDEEIAALKERLQASEQKMQREEARNAWLNEVTGTLRSEIQTLCNEGTKAKLTGKLSDWDWVHEVKQRWKANPSPENIFRLSEALEEHEDQIVVREKTFLKHVRYLTVTHGDEEAPLDLSKAAMILCRRNDVLYTSAERQQQLDRPFTSFPGWNYTVSSEGGTINVPE